MNLSPILLALLYFAKNEIPKDEELTWVHVGKALIRADYDRAYEKLSAVLQLVIPAYLEAIDHPELRVPDPGNAMVNVLRAPYVGSFAMEWPQWKVKLDKQYPLESFYNAMFQQIISDLRLTTVINCPQYIAYTDAQKADFQATMNVPAGISCRYCYDDPSAACISCN